MKREYKILVCLLLVTILISGSVVNAVSLGQGWAGSPKEVLFRVDTFAGNGSFTLEDGSVLLASFRTPYSMAALADGSLVVSDSKNQRIRQISDGKVQTYAGITFEEDLFGNPLGGWSDGKNDMAAFSNPLGITADAKGNIYVADSGNNMIRLITSNGQVTTVAGDGIIGHQDGEGHIARFYDPQDVVVAKDGTIYVADTLNHLIRKITPKGQVLTLNAPSDRIVEVVDGLVEFAGDYLDGNLHEAKFNEPSGLALDNKGNLYVSDTGNQLIRYIDFGANTVTTVGGKLEQSMASLESNEMYVKGGFADGSALEASFNFPKGLAVTKEGGLLIADSGNHGLRYLFNGNVTTLYNQLHNPTDVVVLEDDSILVADSSNNLIRKFTLYQLPEDLPQDNQKKIVKDSQVITLDISPIIVNDHMMVPIFPYAKEMGYLLEVTNDDKIVFVQKDDIIIEFTVDEPKIIVHEGVDKAEKIIKVAPLIRQSVIYLPLRALSEELNLDVQWNQENQTAILREINLGLASSKNIEEGIVTLREAQVEKVVGIAYISQGGVRTTRAFQGMTLSQGDRIITEANSSLIFKVSDRGDEVTIGEKSQLYISELRSLAESKKTKLFLESGGAWVSASSLLSSEDEFRIETTESYMDIKGTHFFVGINPLTGGIMLTVTSGIGVVSNESGDSTIIYPSQQIITMGDDNEILDDTRNIIDLDAFINNASPEIVEAILRSKQAIDEENEEYIQLLRNQQNQTQPMSQDELDRTQSNLENLIGNIIKSAIEQNKVDSDRIRAIIDQTSHETDDILDLNTVKHLKLLEEEQGKQERQRKLEDQRKQQMDEKRQVQEALKKQNEDYLKKIQEKLDEQQAAKKEAQEAARRKAEEEYAKRLGDVARADLVARIKAREEERNRQNTEANQPPVSESGKQVTPGSSTGSDSSDADDSTSPNEPEQPSLSKEFLEMAINEANMNITSVNISTDGADIETTAKWVTEADRQAYQAAVNLAYGVMTNSQAKQEEINQAVEALEVAKNNFEAAKKIGAKIIPALILVSPLEEFATNNWSVDIIVQAEQNTTVTLSVYGRDDLMREGLGLDTNISFNVTDLEEGEYFFTLKARNLAGNEKTQDLPKITIDTSPPWVEGFEVWRNEDDNSLVFQFRAEEGANIDIFLGEYESQVKLASGIGQGEDIIVELSPSQSLPQGPIYFSLKATDLAGNERYSYHELYNE
ncbi:MAG: stalk domain-containing protein [Tissierellales bacterium]